MVEQPMLLPMPEQPPQAVCAAPEPVKRPAARLKEPDRKQCVMDVIDLDKLIPADHLVRGIWDLAQALPSDGFLAENKSVEGGPGRPRTCPRMLLSMWVYSYSKGMGEAEQIALEMRYEPALRWLAGNSLVSGRTLSDFRVVHGQALRETFAGLLGVLAQEGLVDLSELTLDGTKIKANAGNSSQRQKKTLEEHIAKADEVVQQLEKKESSEEISKQAEAGRMRAAKERQERLKLASKELEEIRKSKKAAEREKARVSLTDPESRVMKDGHGGFGMSYNVQVLTETKNKIVVDVAVTQQASDQQQFKGALERAEEATGHKPERMIVDGGYTTAQNIEMAAEQGVDLIGPRMNLEKRQAENLAKSLKKAGISAAFGPSAFIQIEDGKALQCPAGKRMGMQEDSKAYQQYLSKKSDCAGCPHQAECAPKGQRYVKVHRANEAVVRYAERMKEEKNRDLYKKRGPVAEFPHAWFKDKLGLRGFHVRGQEKAGIEMIWGALTYNIQQWFRLSWLTKLAAA